MIPTIDLTDAIAIIARGRFDRTMSDEALAQQIVDALAPNMAQPEPAPGDEP